MSVSSDLNLRPDVVQYASVPMCGLLIEAMRRRNYYVYDVDGCSAISGFFLRFRCKPDSQEVSLNEGVFFGSEFGDGSEGTDLFSDGPLDPLGVVGPDLKDRCSLSEHREALIRLSDEH